jgi:hypothetical protein
MISIILEPIEDNEYAFILFDFNIQVGWCRATQSGWSVFDMDVKFILGPFSNLEDAQNNGIKIFSQNRHSGNPGN